MMRKKKLRRASKRRPVNSHVVLLVPRHSPRMAILNYRGSMAIVMFCMAKGYRDETRWYEKMDVSTLNNEYCTTKFNLDENWWGTGIHITEDTTIERVYRSAMSAFKCLKAEGLISGE